MSGCGDNPAVGTTPDLKLPKYNSYNPAGARLYGLPGPPFLFPEKGKLRDSIAAEINSNDVLKSNVINFDDTAKSLADVVMNIFNSNTFDAMLTRTGTGTLAGPGTGDGDGDGDGDDDDDDDGSNNDQIIACVAGIKTIHSPT